MNEPWKLDILHIWRLNSDLVFKKHIVEFDSSSKILKILMQSFTNIATSLLLYLNHRQPMPEKDDTSSSCNEQQSLMNGENRLFSQSLHFPSPFPTP